MKLLFKISLLCLLTGPVFSQTQNGPSLQDIQQQMQEMQRQMMQQFERMSQGNSFSMPEFQWDTTFSFQFDTIFGDQGMSQRFFFSPFGQDSTFMGDFFSNDFFGNDFQWGFPPGFGNAQNDENSAIDGPDDGLLPEERLRQQGDEQKNPTEKRAAPAPKKPKIKTIRM